MRRQVSPGLDREQLIAAAFAVLERDGLDRLSMRGIAAELGVQAPALYWHFAEKAELLGIMARDIYATAYAAVPVARDWREWLTQFGRALRASFASRRDGARLCATAKPAGNAQPGEQAGKIAAPLIVLGLDQHAALSFQGAVISYALGWAMFEANGPMHDFLDSILDFDDSFQQGLDAIVRGLIPQSASVA